MEGRLLWKEIDVLGSTGKSAAVAPPVAVASKPNKPPIKVCLSVDFDAVSGWLGTGQSPENCLADYSSGFFSAYVGVQRLLRVFKRLNIADKITWFIPGHSIESFPEQTRAILASGCELGLHGYCHEGAAQLTESQEREVLEKCIELAQSLTGRRPTGYRAPLYQLREHTLSLLEEHGFLYDSSLSHRDSTPYWVPRMPPITAPQYEKMEKAAAWMKPLPKSEAPTEKTLVEIPGNWYSEDMTPMQYWPHTPNSHGYVDVRVVERMWMDRFEWIRKERDEAIEEDVEGEAAEMGAPEKAEKDMSVFTLILHPDTSGMAHIIGMIERFLTWVKGMGSDVEWCTYGEVAEAWKTQQNLA